MLPCVLKSVPKNKHGETTALYIFVAWPGSEIYFNCRVEIRFAVSESPSAHLTLSRLHSYFCLLLKSKFWLDPDPAGMTLLHRVTLLPNIGDLCLYNDQTKAVTYMNITRVYR